jgi:hypothetical protein
MKILVDSMLIVPVFFFILHYFFALLDKKKLSYHLFDVQTNNLNIDGFSITNRKENKKKKKS